MHRKTHKCSHPPHPYAPCQGIVLVEAAPGQGETLAAATAGTPWRFEVEKKAGGKVETLAFANFSRALLVSPGSKGEGEVRCRVKGHPSPPAGEKLPICV